MADKTQRRYMQALLDGAEPKGRKKTPSKKSAREAKDKGLPEKKRKK